MQISKGISVKFLNKYKKYLLILVILVGLFFLRSIILRKPDDRLTYVVKREALIETVQVSGVYTASSQTEVFSPTDGIITEIYANNNDEVKKGDPLFHIESTASDEQRASVYASYQSTLTALKIARQGRENSDVGMWAKQKSLIDAENNLNLMNEKLTEGGDNPATKEKYTQLEIDSIKSSVIQTKKDFQAIEKQYKESNQAISSAQALANSTKLAFDATKNITIKSPADGKVVNLLKNIGDVAVAKSFDNNYPVLLVANLKNSAVVAKVSEVDITRIEVGQKAQIVFNSLRQTIFTGTVEIVDIIGTDKGGVVTYNIKISLDEFSPTIRPNMTGIVTIETYRKENTLAVPNTAIIYQGEKTYLQKTGKKKNLIEVELGEKGLIKTEVLNDLPENLEILANGDKF
jgi:multidrug resistance efflux pump